VLSGKYPIMKSDEEIILSKNLAPGTSITLLEPTYYRYAIALFYGDGGMDIIINMLTKNSLIKLYGYEQAIEPVIDSTISIEAVNEGVTEQMTPTIRITYIDW